MKISTNFTLVAIIILLTGFSIDSYCQRTITNDVFTKYQKAKKDFEKFEEEHGNFLQTKNTKVHYLTWGNPMDLPIVWVHGSFTNAYEIKDLAEWFVDAGFYLIAIDYYGHGLTPIPDHEVSLYHVADDIMEILEHENIEKAVVGGWSRGGYIASAFYDSYPESVLGLILEDGGTVAANTHYQGIGEDKLKKLVDELFSERVEYEKFDSELAAYSAYRDSTDQSPQFELLAWITQDKDGSWSIGSGIEELFHMSSPSQFLQNIQRPTQVPLFAKSMAMMEPTIIYRNLRVPMLILDPVDDNDLFPFERQNKKLREMHPNLIQHRIYKNTGHNIHYQRPDAFIKDVLWFLEKIKLNLFKPSALSKIAN